MMKLYSIVFILMTLQVASGAPMPLPQATTPPPLVITTITSLIPSPTNVIVIETITITNTPTATTTGIFDPSSLITLAPLATPTPTPNPTYWSLDFNNGSFSEAFGISEWAYGSNNFAVITSLPSPSSNSSFATPTPTGTTTSLASMNTNKTMEMSGSSSIMQISYPNGSINPGNKDAPTGGVGIYATPLDLSEARNVTLEYSVYFPQGFDFVKGGKLPGLFGGHGGCSGGEESEDCFSTRLMFRPEGQGELYLYIPKAGRTDALCQVKPVSYCDTMYGLSIGRGAWKFATGNWTDVRQDIMLNTPGVADGAFNIWINQKLVMSFDQVLFRNAPPTPAATSTSSKARPTPTSTSPGGMLGGVLGGLLNGIKSGLRKRQIATSTHFVFSTVPFVEATSTQTITTFISPSATPILNPIVNGISNLLGGGGGNTLLATSTKAVSFKGIQFETFFGGHTMDYASPQQQFSYFRSINLQVNS